MGTWPELKRAWRRTKRGVNEATMQAGPTNEQGAIIYQNATPTGTGVYSYLDRCTNKTRSVHFSRRCPTNDAFRDYSCTRKSHTPHKSVIRTPRRIKSLRNSKYDRVCDDTALCQIHHRITCHARHLQPERKTKPRTDPRRQAGTLDQNQAFSFMLIPQAVCISPPVVQSR